MWGGEPSTSGGSSPRRSAAERRASSSDLAHERLHGNAEPRHHRQHAVHLHATTGSSAADGREADADLVGDLLPRHFAGPAPAIERLVEGPGVEATDQSTGST